MSNHTKIIFFIVIGIMVMGTVALFYKDIERRSTQDAPIEDAPDIEGPEIIGIEIRDVNEGEAESVRFEIEGGDEPVYLNQTLITIQTPNGVSDLTVRQT